MTYDEVLTHFQVKKRYQDKAQCQCPAHDDRQASLTVTKGRDSVLIHCHAGCDIDNVLSAAGLKKSDLFYQEKRTGSSWQAYIESREKKRIEAVYNYVSSNGSYLFTKVRMQGKKMIYGTLANERFTYGLGGRTRKELCAVYAPDGVQAINKAVSEGKPIFIPEGEKDADTLAKQGYTAFSYGGVNDWSADMAQLCKGAVVYVLADNDEPGRRVANTIQSDLQGIAKSAKVIVPVPDIPKADISDYFAAGHSKAEFESLLQQDIAVTEKSYGYTADGIGNGDFVTSVGFVAGNEIPHSDGFEDIEGFGGNAVDKLPVFNLDLLPCKVRGFSKALCESLQVSPGMVAPAVVSVSSLGIQKKYAVRPLPGWDEPPNLYIAIVQEPSERKSPTMKEVLVPVYEYETEENERLAPEIATYKAKKEVLENRIRNTINSLSKSGKKKGDEKYLDMGDLDTFQNELNQLEEVAPVRLAVDDVTMEVLGKLLEQNKERIGIMSTEGGIFNILAGRYSDKTVIDIVLKAYSGDRFSQDRLGRKGQTLNNPLITMLLYVQPIIIKEVMENSEFIGRGLNARFLYSIPPSTIGKRRYRVMEIPEADRAEYVDTVKRLLAIPVPENPKAVELDGDADKIAESFFYEIEKEMEDASPEFKAWLGKLHGTTMRIALSLHCLEYIEKSGEHKINGETMGNAIQIGRYFKAHAEAAYNIMGLMDSPEVRDAKYLIKRIESTGLTEIKLRDLQRMCMNRNGMETREGMIPGLVCLIEHGYVRVQKGWTTDKSDKSDKKRGRPSEIIYINPEYIRQKEQK